LALRPWIEGHPNLAAFDDDETMRCPRCNSTDMIRKGYRFTNTGMYARYRCACGGWARGRYTENTLNKRKSLLAA
jgi:transposase-like protein